MYQGPLTLDHDGRMDAADAAVSGGASVTPGVCPFTVGKPIESLEIPHEFDEMLGPYDATQQQPVPSDADP